MFSCAMIASAIGNGRYERVTAVIGAVAEVQITQLALGPGLKTRPLSADGTGAAHRHSWTVASLATR
jgi:hypothetical protein